MSGREAGSAGSTGASGVVLAGGLSRRMGQPKAALSIAGEPLLRRVASRLLQAVPEVLVVGPPELSRLVPELPVVADLHPGIGPLAGIETALQAVTSSLIFVAACDLPFINPLLVSGMVQYAVDHPGADIVALAAAGTDPAQGGAWRIQPLHAVYRRSCLPVITRHITSGNFALFQLFSELHVCSFPERLTAQLDPSGLSTLNANSPEDWEHALALASTPPS